MKSNAVVDNHSSFSGTQRFIRLGAQSISCAVAVVSAMTPSLSNDSTSTPATLQETPTTFSTNQHQPSNRGIFDWFDPLGFIKSWLTAKKPRAQGCSARAPDEFCSYQIKGTSTTVIASDNEYNKFHVHNVLGQKAVILEGSSHPRFLKVFNGVGNTVITVHASAASRELQITNYGGSSELNVQASPSVRLLTLTTPNGRFERQYSIPSNVSAQLMAVGPAEEYLVKISGTTEAEKATADASVPVAPKSLVLREYSRPDVYAKTAHDTELIEKYEDGKEQSVVFKNPEAKEYVQEEYKKQFGDLPTPDNYPIIEKTYQIILQPTNSSKGTAAMEQPAKKEPEEERQDFK